MPIVPSSPGYDIYVSENRYLTIGVLLDELSYMNFEKEGAYLHIRIVQHWGRKCTEYTFLANGMKVSEELWRERYGVLFHDEIDKYSKILIDFFGLNPFENL